ncbi:MAG: hypothetical protein ACXAC7_18080, partial [Candidatus Hodarchaeales archaeon]
MKQGFFHFLDLGRTRIFPFRDLWLFILAVIFISTTSAAIGAFVTGIRPVEFFLGDEEDILVITQPDISTPVTGSVPESLKDDVEELEGVEKASAEILGVVMAYKPSSEKKKQAVVIRGITRDFEELSAKGSLVGSWFDQFYLDQNGTYNSSKVFQSSGAVVGSKLAESEKIKIGNKITLISTLATMTLEVIITGILETGTPIDNELLLSLATARAITGRAPGDVTFVRAKVNPDILTIQGLKTKLNDNYELVVEVLSYDPNLTNLLEGEPVLAYSSTGLVIQTQYLDSEGKTVFKLPFGTYQFVASPSFIEQSNISKKIFTDQNPLPKLVLNIGKKRFSLSINVTYNKEPVFNASILVESHFDINETYTGSTGTNGSITFELKEDFYKIITKYNKIFENITEFRLESSLKIKISFENYFNLSIFNASTGEEINTGSVQLINSTNPTDPQINRDSYQSGEIIYIDVPGFYSITYTNGEKQRTWTQEIYGNTSHKMYFGEAILAVRILDFDEGILTGCNVEITNVANETQDIQITDSTGLTLFELETGQKYTIFATHPVNNTKNNRSIFFTQWETVNFSIEPIEMFFLDLKVYNGSLSNDGYNGIEACNITVSDLTDMILKRNKTDSNGNIRINLSKPGEYKINATFLNFNWSNSVIIGALTEFTILNIPLGPVKVVVTTLTTSNFPINGTEISIINMQNENVERIGYTNERGESIFYIKPGIYSIKVKNILAYIKYYFFTLNESQIFQFNTTFDLEGIIVLKILDSKGYEVPGISVTVKNDIYGNSLVGITNEEAEIKFNNVRWGNYSVNIIKQGILNESFSLAFASAKYTYLYWSNLPHSYLSDTWEFTKWRGQINIDIIESADYLSDFLKTTLQVIETTFGALLIVISGLSLISISSVISHPITSNAKNLLLYQTVGSSSKQVKYIVGVQMILIGFLA